MDLDRVFLIYLSIYDNKIQSKFMHLVLIKSRYGRPPAPESSIQAIPELPFTESMQRDTDGCAVCQDPFELESMVSKLPCKHIYHKECILPWLREHDSCPVCRAFISPQEDPSL